MNADSDAPLTESPKRLLDLSDAGTEEFKNRLAKFLQDLSGDLQPPKPSPEGK